MLPKISRCSMPACHKELPTSYALAIANELDIDLATAMRQKMVKNREKYPAEEYHGR